MVGWSAIGPSGDRSQGRWTDLGNNIVELKNYDTADWTASTWKGVIHVLHPVAKHEYGQR